MLWSEFYDKYIDWSESTINSKISSLEDIGPGDEVLEVLYELSSEKVKDKQTSRWNKAIVLDFLSIF